MPLGSSASPMLRHLHFLTLTVLLTGCATVSQRTAERPAREFHFGQDTFAFANELIWEYGPDANGVWHGHKRVPKPSYTLHCYVLARTAEQFFLNAQFHPELRRSSAIEYERIVKQVVRSNPRKALAQRIVVPGYTNLFQFSAEHEPLLKRCSGRATESYFQRGNWRVPFPFTRSGQERTCDRAVTAIAERGVTVLHIEQFPKLNHVVIAFKAEPNGANTVFTVYDPNFPSAPRQITFDAAARSFIMPPTDYFKGGAVNAYEIYRNFIY